MGRPPRTRTMTCSHCGKRFDGNPQNQPLGRENYCSISCEEGNGPLPDSDPQSPNFWLHVQGDPESIVGSPLIATGLKRVDYSPDWCRNPEDVHSSALHDHMPEEEVYIRRTDVVVGTIVSYEANDYADSVYVVERENPETGEIVTREIRDSVLLDRLRRDQWWVEY